MPPEKSIVDKLKKPLVLLLAVLFFGSGTLYYYIKGDTKAPGFGSHADDYSVTGMELHFLDVGQGDCTLLLHEEYAVLIDGGEYENGSFIRSYLKEHGVEKLDLMVASHRHSDHLGGLTAVLEEVEVTEILINPDRNSEDVDSFAQTIFLDAAAEQDLTVTVAQAGMTYSFEDMHITVLSAFSENTDENEHSVVLTASCEGITALFTGDIGGAAEKELVQAGCLSDCDILKMAHHGSNYSNSDTFLHVISPEVAVVSCGVDNMYGHPGADALYRFAAIGADVYRTDLNGTVQITCSAGKINVITDGKDREK